MKAVFPSNFAKKTCICPCASSRFELVVQDYSCAGDSNSISCTVNMPGAGGGMSMRITKSYLQGCSSDNVVKLHEMGLKSVDFFLYPQVRRGCPCALALDRIDTVCEW